jgi:hypothetical protein
LPEVAGQIALNSSKASVPVATAAQAVQMSQQNESLESSGVAVAAAWQLLYE